MHNRNRTSNSGPNSSVLPKPPTNDRQLPHNWEILHYLIPIPKTFTLTFARTRPCIIILKIISFIYILVAYDVLVDIKPHMV